jgi:hypothetical protein
MEAAARLERIDRRLGELGEVLRLLADGPPPVPRPAVTEAVTEAEIDVGPFLTLAAVENLQAQIGGLPAVADVALRGFAGDRALLDVNLR